MNMTSFKQELKLIDFSSKTSRLKRERQFTVEAKSKVFMIQCTHKKDERRIKEMNKGVKDTDQKRLKEEDTTKVPAKVEVTEQGTKKRKGGHVQEIDCSEEKAISNENSQIVKQGIITRWGLSCYIQSNGTSSKHFNDLMENDGILNEENDQKLKGDFLFPRIFAKECYDLELEVERESTVALDLIRFIKQQIDEE
ncbi:hypothetical protein Tco_0133989 [Tanacetum coccineum]